MAGYFALLNRRDTSACSVATSSAFSPLASVWVPTTSVARADLEKPSQYSRSCQMVAASASQR